MPKPCAHLVVLGFPLVRVCSVLQPLLVLRDGEEIDLLVSLRDTNNRRDELDQELRDLEKGRIKVVEVVENETLDVRTIMILYALKSTANNTREMGRANLIGHNHKLAVP